MSSGLNENSEGKMKAEIKLYCDPKLKDVLADLAEAARLPLSDFIVKKLAGMAGRKDLSTIPRKKMGRPITRSAS